MARRKAAKSLRDKWKTTRENVVNTIAATATNGSFSEVVGRSGQDNAEASALEDGTGTSSDTDDSQVWADAALIEVNYALQELNSRGVFTQDFYSVLDERITWIIH